MRVIIAFLALFALAQAAEIGIANLRGTAKDSGITGTVYFVMTDATHITVFPYISGITVNPGTTHGMHIHQYGDLTGTLDGASVGSHYAGAGSTTHGCETSSPRHEGDMGNWQVTAGAINSQNKTIDLAILNGANSVIGKAVVLHSQTDDCAVTTSSGDRLAFGVIGIANFNLTFPAEVLAALGGTQPTSNSASSADNTVTKAIAVLNPTTISTTYTNVRGNVSFSQDPAGVVTVTAAITGLTAAQAFGFHIHVYGDYSINGLAAGGHYNPGAQPHGSPLNASRHAGDLGNICTYDANGVAYYKYSVTDGAISLTDPAKGILGRNVVVHAVFDTAAPNAAFGDRIASGVIGVYNPAAAADFVSIPSGVTVQDPVCASFAPTPTPTPTPTATTSATPTTPPTSPAVTTSSSSSSFVIVNTFAVFLLASLVVLF